MVRRSRQRRGAVGSEKGVPLQKDGLQKTIEIREQVPDLIGQNLASGRRGPQPKRPPAAPAHVVISPEEESPK
jgi:hypothetical protein